MNILRDKILKKILETTFVSNSDERERRESLYLHVTAVGSSPKTVNVPRRSAGFVVMAAGRFEVGTSGSFD